MDESEVPRFFWPTLYSDVEAIFLFFSYAVQAYLQCGAKTGSAIFWLACTAVLQLHFVIVLYIS